MIKKIFNLLKKKELNGCNALTIFLLKYILIKKENITINYKNKQLILPNNITSLGVINEIFVEEDYKYLKVKNKKVLDLGGYIGDTAIYFLANGAEYIEVYEPNKKNFKYLQKNTKKFSNIKIFNKGVTVKPVNVYLYKGKNVSLMTQIKESKKVKKSKNTISIAGILKKKRFDILKMDIEGGEYEIIKYFMNKKTRFEFHSGIIEFHLYKKIDHIILKKFLTFLDKKKYYYKTIDKIDTLKLIYFEKQRK